MTNRERIIALLADHAGLDDDELSLRASVRPRQQVNQICRALEAEGILKRIPGPYGKIINVLNARGSAPATVASPPAVPTVKTVPSTTVSPEAFRIAEPLRTLILIPCSGEKSRANGLSQGRAITDDLPDVLSLALRDARKNIAGSISLDESTRMAAWRRYEGSFYKASATDIGRAIAQGQRIVIISGGYGLVCAGEPIGFYNAIFRCSDWPRNLLEDVILEYVKRHQLTAVRALASATTDYARLVRKVPWRRAEISDAWLLVAEPTTGAMKKSPRTQGEALSNLLNGHLHPDWRSSDGLGLQAVRLS